MPQNFSAPGLCSSDTVSLCNWSMFVFDDPAFFDDDDSFTDTTGDEGVAVTECPTSTSTLQVDNAVTLNSMTASQQWLHALQCACAVVRQRRPSLESLYESQNYLIQAQRILRTPAHCRNSSKNNKKKQQASGGDEADNRPPRVLPPDLLPEWSAMATAKTNSSMLRGPFSTTFADTTRTFDGQSTLETNMSQRRLLIRLLTARSEVLACIATACRWAQPHPTWSHGAQLYQESLDHIHHAITLADGEVARAYGNTYNCINSKTESSALISDVSIVETSIGHLVAHKSKYEKAATTAERSLRQKLERQPVLSKDELQLKYGNRPKQLQYRPTGMSFKQRRALELAQLADVELALARLEELSIPEFRDSNDIAVEVEDLLS